MASEQVELGTGPPAEIEEDAPGHAVARPGDTSSVDDLIRLAIQRDGFDVEALERLVALRERVEERQARKAFYDAKGAFQAECPPILKSRDGLTTKTGQVVAKYAPIDRVLAVAGPVLRKHGFSWSWNARLENEQQHIDCVLTHELGHSETATFTAPVQKISKLTSAAQDSAGAATYGRRQSFCMVTGIVTADEDTDGAVEPPEPISAKHAADLRDHLDDVGADEAAFCRWFGVESLEEVPQSRWYEAVHAVERKREQAAKGSG